MSIEKIEEELEKCIGYLRSRDKEVKYYKPQTLLYYKGQLYNLAEKAAICMLQHYMIYIKEKDVKSAGETIEKIHHFFPMYNFEQFFKEYR